MHLLLRRRARWGLPIRITTVVVTILGTGIGLSLLSSGPAYAAGTTRYVALSGSNAENDCTDPDSPCATITYAVGQAAPGDTISLAAGTYQQSATIRISLTVTGAGSDQTIIEGDDDVSISVDGTDTETPPTVTIENLAVSNNPGDDGIDVTAATVALQDCDVSNNDKDGVYVLQGGGGLATRVTISHCSINDNGSDGVELDEGEGEGEQGDATDNYGAAIDHSTLNGNGGGGVVVEGGSASVSTSTLDHNMGAGVVADGDGTAITVTDSTISNTQPFSEREGGVFGGGVLVFPGGIGTIDTSTLTGNTGQGVLDWHGQVSVTNSTITGTKAGLDDGDETPSGAVVFQGEVPGLRLGPQALIGDSPQLSPSLTLSGTLLADNIAPNCTGGITDSGYNLSDTDSCALEATGSVNSGVAKLGALADNGGPTWTQLPDKGSDAIDAIPAGSAGCSGDATDQRGDARLAGARCDIGAVEVAQPPIVVTPDTLPHGKVGTTYQVTLQATGGLGAPYEFSVSSGALPSGLKLSEDGAITGTPTKSGTFEFTIAVDDPTYQDFAIVIDAPTSTMTSSATTTTSSSPTRTSTSAPATMSSASPTSSSVLPTSSSGFAPSTTTSSGPALADTGVQAAGTLGVGGVAILLGLALMVWAGSFRYVPRRRRR